LAIWLNKVEIAIEPKRERNSTKKVICRLTISYSQLSTLPYNQKNTNLSSSNDDDQYILTGPVDTVTH